ncbi:MAG: GNAT family N-acetyltransferase [Sulfuricurvum sp.]|nr:GNAT family N-acetyltransferase [Sulfuricurvum sp.]
MDANVTIRKAKSNDVPAMAGLLAELFAIEDDFIIDRDKQIRGLQLLLQYQGSIIVVAEISNRVIGMISMQSLISTAMGERVGLIEDMIVSHEYRGIGVGRLLLGSMIEHAHILGYGRIALGADKRNISAITFYQKFEFEMNNMGLMYYLPRAP